MIKKLYIAYGSNLNTEQMNFRCWDAVPVGKSVLEDYELTFRGTRRGYGVANIEKSKGSTVPVGIWAISDSDEYNLDIYEGFPTLYTKVYKTFKLDGQTMSGLVYIMQPGHVISPPPSGYLQTIKDGYKDFQLDQGYLDEAVSRCLEICSK